MAWVSFYTCLSEQRRQSFNHTSAFIECRVKIDNFAKHSGNYFLSLHGNVSRALNIPILIILSPCSDLYLVWGYCFKFFSVSSTSHLKWNFLTYCLPLAHFIQWRHNGRNGVLNLPASALFLLNCLSSADQRKHQSSASLAFVRGIHRWPVNSTHKGLVTRKMFPFDDIIMYVHLLCRHCFGKGMCAEHCVNHWWLLQEHLLEIVFHINPHYRQTSNIRHILVGNKRVVHSDVVGAAPTTSSFST